MNKGCMKQIGLEKFENWKYIGTENITDDEVKDHLNKNSCLEKEVMVGFELDEKVLVEAATKDVLEVEVKKKIIGTYCFCNDKDLCNKDDAADSGSGRNLIGSTFMMTVLMGFLIIFKAV